MCRCIPLEERQARTEWLRRNGGDGWAYISEICRCCGAEIVDASNKYKKWFCPSCLSRADQVNRACGFCAIPIGWHSFVNGMYHRASSARTRAGATAVADQLSTFFRESNGVWDWGRSVVERQWKHAGLPLGKDVAAEDYLIAVQTRGLDPVDLFEELAEARGIDRCYWPSEPFSFEAAWHKVEGGPVFECSDRIIWLFPSGTEDYARLTLRVAPEHEGTWSWSVTITSDALPDGEQVLAAGVESMPTSAQVACEDVAIRLVQRQERASASGWEIRS